MTAAELAEAIRKVRGVLVSESQALVVAAAMRHLATLMTEEGEE